MSQARSEEQESLWQLVAAPLVWAAHFFTSYFMCAVWCAKYAGPHGSLATPRVALALLTGAALLALWVLGRRAWSRHALPGGAPPHAEDTIESRHRFLGLATLLLTGLSALAVTFSAFAIALIRSCT